MQNEKKEKSEVKRSHKIENDTNKKTSNNKSNAKKSNRQSTKNNKNETKAKKKNASTSRKKDDSNLDSKTKKPVEKNSTKSKGSTNKKTSSNRSSKSRTSQKKKDLEKTQILQKGDIEEYKKVLPDTIMSDIDKNLNKQNLDETVILNESDKESIKQIEPEMSDIFSNTTKIDFQNIKNNLKSEVMDDFYIEKKSGNFKMLCIILFILVIILIGFIIAHFCTFNHNKKVIIKEKKVSYSVLNENNVFLGDSLTHRYDLKKYFEDKPIVNSGEDGYKTTDILDNLEKMVYEYNPSKVFLLIGTNDLPTTSIDEIVNNIKKIVSKIKENKAYTTIYIESLYPINPEKIKNRKNEDIDEINKKLEQLCKDEKINYIDINSILKNDDGNLKEEYSDDGLHMNEVAYENISNQLRQYLK